MNHSSTPEEAFQTITRTIICGDRLVFFPSRVQHCDNHGRIRGEYSIPNSIYDNINAELGFAAAIGWAAGGKVERSEFSSRTYVFMGC